MHHISWDDTTPYNIAILIKEPALKKQDIQQHYCTDIGVDGTVAFSLDYGGKKKPTASIIHAYLANLLPALNSINIDVIYCADGEYFKKLTKQSKAEPHLGYVLPCAIEGYEHINVVYGVNYQSLFYDPKNKEKLALSLKTLNDFITNKYKPPGTGIIHSEVYPKTLQEIESFLDSLHQYPALAADFEAFSLFFGDAGIGTVGFAWDQHNGGAFSCDYVSSSLVAGHHGIKNTNYKVRALLKKFFTEYKGKLIWHNANYDLKVAVYSLWMDEYLDYDGMLKGIEVMTKHFDDTKVLTYLATNSCAGNKLSLKEQAHEFAGNYAQEDINDIKLIPENELLRYNLVDCLSTWYTYNKHNPTVDKDNQRNIYDSLFKPAIAQILQMELNGMPMDMNAVHKANKRLNRLYSKYYSFLQDKLEAMGYLKYLRMQEVIQYNTTRKVKRKTEDDFKDLELNPGSPKQLQHLLYEFFNLPVIDLTDTKEPATGAKTLDKLINHTTVNDQKMVIRALISISKVSKILQAFMPNFLNAIKVSDGTHRLYGGFNIGGTLSGRLSSSKPNLQQLPSGSTYGKLIKKCFKAPPNFIFGGADFNSLEDYVSALTTKDSNKIKVYEQGYDGHCLRAYYYFNDQFPGLKEIPEDINKIKDESVYGTLRQDSKAPTFALTYQGTFKTLMDACGFTKDKALEIEAAYHTLYKESDDWVQAKLQQASIDGYVTVAYGLRVRTPKIKSVIWGGPKVPYKAVAEGRTAGNALGQSYGLVNSRAAIDLQQRINKSKYRGMIHICSLIHDAIYLMFPDDVEIVKWINDNLIDCMESHGLPELDWHPDVKIGAELDLFYPDWSNGITLKNNISVDEIINTVKNKTGA